MVRNGTENEEVGTRNAEQADPVRLFHVPRSDFRVRSPYRTTIFASPLWPSLVARKTALPEERGWTSAWAP